MCTALARRFDNGSLTTLSHLALILVYTCVLAIKTCEFSPEACSSYGFGSSAEGVRAHPERAFLLMLTDVPFFGHLALAGFFLFFIFFGISMLIFQLAFEAIAIAYHIRQQDKLRRLRYRGGKLVELPPLSKEEFAHLPGLESSQCYHLFLSRELTTQSKMREVAMYTLPLHNF
jgi:hypothetical protein